MYVYVCVLEGWKRLLYEMNDRDCPVKETVYVGEADTKAPTEGKEGKEKNNKNKQKIN